ncbi:MAG: hypothetical protein HFG15_03520 [Bacilli bacterium]|jgi:hypothetical protein|nr:hypothetical protein [Bacilli bacterium]
MNFDESKLFDHYVDNFKTLQLADKKQITVDELKLLVGVLSELNKQDSNEALLFINRMISNLNVENKSEDDYAETVFVYIKYIQELLAQYVERN